MKGNCTNISDWRFHVYQKAKFLIITCTVKTFKGFEEEDYEEATFLDY